MRGVWLILLLLSACVHHVRPPDEAWLLESIDDAPVTGVFPGALAPGFPETGAFEGQAPCNRFTARQSADPPRLRIEALTATERSCPDALYEARFLELIGNLSHVTDRNGPQMTIATKAGEKLVFRLSPVLSE